MTLGGTNTYVVGRAPAYVVDPGPDDAGHLDAVRTEGEARGGIAGVVLTHSHADHSAGVARLGAPLLWGQVSEGDESAAVLGDGAVDAASLDHPSDRKRSELAGAFEIEPFNALFTPGHASDHVVFLWEQVCFCGDLILGEGSTIVPPAAFGGSLVDYMESLRRVRELDVSLLAPGHGPLITEPRVRIDEYLAHRKAREARLVEALDAGERSRARLLEAAWDDVPEILRPAAAMAMQAHLEKLEAEGRLVAAELHA
jgi:glyoxylase-like metal-dependent hydrolase (beta-lactamase superfamily II)